MSASLQRKVRRTALAILLWPPFRFLTRRLLLVDRSLVVISALERRLSFGISAILSTEQAPRGFVFASGRFDSVALHRKVSKEDMPSSDNMPSSELTTDGDSQLQLVSNLLIPVHEKRNIVKHRCESSVSISRFPATTRKQRTYDNSHRVRFRHGLHFSLRGNVNRPRYLIITLTDVRSISEAVRYPVDALGEIAESQLTDTLVVAIQPRTEEGAAVSRLTSITLSQRIRDLAIELLAQYSVTEASLVFYATGQSIVRLSHVSHAFPAASSIFLSEPRDAHPVGEFSISREDKRTHIEQLLYESPNIDRMSIHSTQHLFCTKYVLDRMMLSADAAPSSIETRFYIFEHATLPFEDLARPAAITLLLALISDPVPRPGEQVTELRLYPNSNYSGAQIRIDQCAGSANASTWFFLTASKGRLVHWSMTSHQLPFVKYTNPFQRIDDHNLIALDRIMGAVSFDVGHGVKYHGLNLRENYKDGS